MKKFMSRISMMSIGLSLLLFSTVFCLGQTELPPLDFVGAQDNAPESQTIIVRVPPESRIEISDPRLIGAELREAGEETSELTVKLNTEGLEANDDGAEYNGRIVVGDAYIIPIRFIFFIRTPKECLRKPGLSIQQFWRGTVDNFVGVEATAPSPYLISTGLLQRRYDDLGSNKRYFGDSFRLGSCRVCAIQVWVRAKREGELDDNDTLSFDISDAVTPYNAVGVGPVFSPMWSGVGSPHTFYAEIPGSVANPQITGKTTPMLDVVSQDDTAIDYTRVLIWRY